MKQNQKLFFCLIFLFVFVYTKLIIVFNQSVSRICLTYFFTIMMKYAWHQHKLQSWEPFRQNITVSQAGLKARSFYTNMYFCTSLLSVQPNQSSKVLSINGSQMQWCSTFQLFPKHQCETDTEKLFLSILNSH